MARGVVRDSKVFVHTCRSVFKDWEDKFGLHERSADDHVLAPSVVFASDRIFVSIDLERRDGWLRMFLGPLSADGTVPPSSGPVVEGREPECRWTDLMTLLKRRHVRLGWRRHSLRHPEDVAKATAELTRLKTLAETHAADVLRGDAAALER